MAQIFIKYQDGSWDYAGMHPLQYIEGRAVQVAIYVGKGQRLIVILVILIFQRFQKRGDCVLEETFVPRNFALNVGDRSSSRISARRLVTPCLRYTGECIKP